MSHHGRTIRHMRSTTRQRAWGLGVGIDQMPTEVTSARRELGNAQTENAARRAAGAHVISLAARCPIRLRIVCARMIGPGLRGRRPGTLAARSMHLRPRGGIAGGVAGGAAGGVVGRIVASMRCVSFACPCACLSLSISPARTRWGPSLVRACGHCNSLLLPQACSPKRCLREIHFSEPCISASRAHRGVAHVPVGSCEGVRCCSLGCMDCACSPLDTRS